MTRRQAAAAPTTTEAVTALDDPMLGRRRPAREAAMRAKLDGREWAWSGGPYAALDFTFAVRSDDLHAGEYLGTALAPLACDRVAEHVYSLAERAPRSGRVSVYLDGRCIMRTAIAAAAAPHLLWHVNRSAIRESGSYLLIHASGAAFAGRAVVFPAATESGKTTLVAGLLQRGLDYLSDEIVAIDPTTAFAHPYPKSLSVDPGSWDVLGALQPRLEADLAGFAITQWQVDPRTVGEGTIASPCPVAAVVTPEYRAGAATCLEPVSRAVGVRLLVENAFNFADHGTPGLDALATVVSGAECYRLTVGALGDACDVVADLLGAEGRTDRLRAGALR